MDSESVDLIILESTGSTMDAARERVASGRFRPSQDLVSCACVMAHEQTAGRGQRGRRWFTPRGESLCATYVLHSPELTAPARSGWLALIAGVAAREALLPHVGAAAMGLK